MSTEQNNFNNKSLENTNPEDISLDDVSLDDVSLDDISLDDVSLDDAIPDDTSLGDIELGDIEPGDIDLEDSTPTATSDSVAELDIDLDDSSELDINIDGESSSKKDKEASGASGDSETSEITDTDIDLDFSRESLLGSNTDIEQDIEQDVKQDIEQDEEQSLDFNFDNFDTFGNELSEYDEEVSDTSDLDISVSELIQEIDISSMCRDYYGSVVKALNVIDVSLLQPETDAIKVTHAEYSYLDKEAIEPLKLFIKTLATSEEGQEMSPEEAAEYICDTITEDIPEIKIGDHLVEFISQTKKLFDDYRKITKVKEVTSEGRIADLLDIDRIRKAKFVFDINGSLWNIITLLLNSPDFATDALMFAPKQGIYFLARRGIALNSFLESEDYQGNYTNITCGQVLNCVRQVLSPDNMSQVLHITIDQTSTMSAGELLRRYILEEYRSGILNLDNFVEQIGSLIPLDYVVGENAQSDTYLLNGVYGYFSTGFYQTTNRHLGLSDVMSVVHEILYYIYTLARGYRVHENESSRDQNMRFLCEFSVGLIKFFNLLKKESPIITPVCYDKIGPADPDNDDNREYIISFSLNKVDYTVKTNHNLLDFVGDSNNILCIPSFLEITPDMDGVTCVNEDGDEGIIEPCCVMPPMDVFRDLTKIAVAANTRAVKKDGSTGIVDFVYYPSYSWLATRTNISSEDIKGLTKQDTSIQRTSSALLSTLLSYTNKFSMDTSNEGPEIKQLNATYQDEPLTAIYTVNIPYISDNIIATLDSRLEVLLLNDEIISTKGEVIPDPESNSCLINYNQDTITLDLDKCEIIESRLEDAEKGSPLVTPASIFTLPKTIPAYYYSNPYLRTINKILCSRNALDYNEELTAVRQIIISDLSNLILPSRLEEALVLELLKVYLKRVKEEGTLGYENFRVCKMLCRSLNIDDALKFAKNEEESEEGSNDFEKKVWDDECTEQLENILKNYHVDCTTICAELDSFNPNIIALQALFSKTSESITEHDRERYLAMLSLPGVHERLRNLEERMVLLRILNEIDDDIEYVLRRKKKLLKAYKAQVTRESLEAAETSLREAFKMPRPKKKKNKNGATDESDDELHPDKYNTFNLTAAVLEQDVRESASLLKDFALENNLYGLLTTMSGSSDPEEIRISNAFADSLGLDAAGLPHFLQMSEKSFNEALSSGLCAVSAFRAFNINRDNVIELVYRGLLAEVGTTNLLSVVKAYDLLLTHGAVLFNITQIPEGRTKKKNLSSMVSNATIIAQSMASMANSEADNTTTGTSTDVSAGSAGSAGDSTSSSNLVTSGDYSSASTGVALNKDMEIYNLSPRELSLDHNFENYVLSFFVSYCCLSGEAELAACSDNTRVETLRQYPDCFECSVDMRLYQGAAVHDFGSLSLE